MRDDSAAVGELRDQGGRVLRHLERVAEFLVLAEDRITHVDADVRDVDVRSDVEPHAFFREFRIDLRAVLFRDGRLEVVVRDLGVLEVALH